MNKQLKVNEIYELINLLGGITGTSPQGKEIVVTGFCNEKPISEGIRRIANKTFKKLSDNYPREQFQTIMSLKVDELYDGKLPDNYEVTPEDNAKLAVLKDSKFSELMTSEVNLEFEELPDWNIMNQRLEDKKESLSYNYSYLFEKLFLNY